MKNPFTLHVKNRTVNFDHITVRLLLHARRNSPSLIDLLQ